MNNKIKKIVIALVDLAAVVGYMSVLISLLGVFLNDLSNWKYVTLSEITNSQFFGDNNIWFYLIIFSLIYIPIRLLLQENFGRLFLMQDSKEVGTSFIQYILI